MSIPKDPYVFLSYASTERDGAIAVADALEGGGVPVWIDREAIAGGTSWGKEIVEGIQHCTVLLIACTPAALRSRNVRQEIQLAWRYEKPYLPLLLQPVEFPTDVLYFLEGYQWVEAGGAASDIWLPAVLKALSRFGLQGSKRQSGDAPSPGPLSPNNGGTNNELGIAPPTGSEARGSAPKVGGQGANSGAFVGRETELIRLRTALDEATSGRGRLVLLAGEPDIGKTRLAEELAETARQRGAQVLWGRCWEGDGAPAYYPWAGIVRSYLRGVENQVAVAEFGAGAAEIAQLAADVRAFLPGLPVLPPVADPEQARFRLFEAITGWLRAAATRQPVVVILDDLHWADKPSLVLLQFLAQELGSLPLLVLGTYRDVELDRRHPLAEALGVLRRERGHERILLHGLNEAETAVLLEAGLTRPSGTVSMLRTERASSEIDGQRGAPGHGAAGVAALAAVLHQETEGNPFFLQETLRHLLESGRLGQSEHLVSTAAGIAQLGIPEGVREVVGRRLSRLSEACNRLLAVAAVMGREFDAVALERMAGANADAVDAALEEAEAARLLASVPGTADRFRFSHALVRETLYEELPARRRARLHRQAGEALEERYVRSLPAHAVELAYHYVQAGDVATEPALRFSRLAAQQAESTTAWEEATKHYEQCVELLAGAADSAGVDEAELLTALGRCQRAAGEYRAAWRSLQRAVTLCRECGDGPALARAALEILIIVGRTERQLALAQEAIALVRDRAPELEMRLQMALCRPVFGAETIRRAGARVAELARTNPIPEVEPWLRAHAGWQAATEMRFKEARAGLRAAIADFEALGRQREPYWTFWMTDALAHEGRLDEAMVASQEALPWARKVHTQVWEQNLLLRIAGIRLGRCEYTEFEGAVAEVPGENFSVTILRAQLLAMRGYAEAAIGLLPAPEQAGGNPAFAVSLHGGRARIHHLLGDGRAARHEFEAALAAHAHVPRESRFEEIHLWLLTGADSAFTAYADDATVREMYEELTDCAPVHFGLAGPPSYDRLRGDLALRLGLVEAAAEHYRIAVELTERERCPVELGRSLQGRAEVAVLQGRPDEARQHLARAAELFERHEAVLYLNQVQARQATLAGPRPQ